MQRLKTCSKVIFPLWSSPWYDLRGPSRLPKSNNIRTLNNFWPISLLSISKVLERHKHLVHYLEQSSIFLSSKLGFRASHACEIILNKLTNNCLTSIDVSQMTGVVYLDFRKAFDLVSHSVLSHKLTAYNLSDDINKLFLSYLSDRQQKVLVNGAIFFLRLEYFTGFRSALC